MKIYGKHNNNTVFDMQDILLINSNYNHNIRLRSKSYKFIINILHKFHINLKLDTEN